MEVLVEESSSYEKCLEKITKKYGPSIEVTRTETKKKGGIFGLFAREVVSVTFLIYNKPFVPQNLKPREEGIKEEPIQISTKPIKLLSAPLNDDEERLKILKRAAEQSENMAAKVDPYIRKIEKSFPVENDQIQKLADTVNKLVEHIADKKTESSEHENVEKISEILENNDFSAKYIKFITGRIKKDLTLSELSDFDCVQRAVLDWIAESVCIAEPVIDGTKGRTVILVGPTGVGKTTTLAKLSAYYVKVVSKELGHPVNVQVITIDDYRIGAIFQMKRYCEIMEIPLAIAQNSQDLYKYLELYKNSADVICIDTTGRSPNDQRNILEMQECLSVIDSENSIIYLTISAVAKASDIKEIINQYKGFKYSGLIITKLDETLHSGSLISILHECKIPVVYVTSGQEVPKNIQKASTTTFLKKLKGFVLEEDYIEKKFGDEKPIIWK